MIKPGDLTINIRGRLMDFHTPKVMGILNVTPDSFFAGSRTLQPEKISERVKEIVKEGADIIDIGGCSTRPGYVAPTTEEEWQRIDLACGIVKNIAPEIPISVDTFRAEVASKAISKWEVDIINDVSGGTDPDMWPLVADQKITYVLTHNSAESDSEEKKEEKIDITAKVLTNLAKSINELHRLGVCDVIVDPGFGFGKTLEQNFQLLDELNEFQRIGLPLLVGVSRKSMIYRSLDVTPQESLWGSIALEAIGLEKGANILRVHDVKPTVDIVKVFTKLKGR